MAWDGKARPTQLYQLQAAEPWRQFAACAGHSRLAPTAWDDVATEVGREDDEARKRRIDAAKAVCRNECVVRAECLRDANPKVDSGVRGGEDMRDAKEALKRRKPLEPGDPRHGTVNGYTNYRCRCAECTAAQAQYLAEYKRRQREKRAS